MSKKKKTSNTSKKATNKVIDKKVSSKITADIDNSFRDEIDNKKRRSDKQIAIKVEDDKVKSKPVVKHTIVHSFLVIVLLTSLVYFFVSLFYSNDGSVSTLVNSLLLMAFTIIFVSVSITTNRKNKIGFFAGALILFIYFIFGILVSMGKVDLSFLSSSMSKFSSNTVIDFRGKNLTEVIKWSEKNSIDIVQDYEYSDMIEEYLIISQDVEPGTKISDVESITVAVSEGPSPYKEIVVPNMLTWDSERVLQFIKENHLSNVVVEFVESSKAVDTVIEQSKSGNLKRNEELKLVFSYGEELDYSEVKLIDFTNMSKFEVIFYLKQHHLNYEFNEDFSSKIKRGYAVKQNIKAGTMVKVNDEKVIVTISKGPEIKVPDLTKMSMTEITDWVIKNKLKLEFTDKYDDSIEENSVISANYKGGDVVEEGTTIEVVISRGKLTMSKFNSFGEFRDWADKYGVKYEEQHEFSDSVSAGEVISYSYKDGETIKNNDSVIVVISDGKSSEVPNVVSSTKEQANTKLKNAGFKCNFVYSYSNSVSEGKVIKQSISAGSKVAQGTTVTVTISKGKKPASSSSSSSSGSSSNNSSSSSSGGSTTTTPTCDTSKGAVFWAGVGNTGAQVYSATKAQNPGFTITPTYVDSCPNGATTSGMVCSMNINEGTWVSYCTTIKMTIVK